MSCTTLLRFGKIAILLRKQLTSGIALSICIVSTYSSFSQLSKTDELYKTILSKDSLLFNIGFNTCDIKQFELLLSKDFKFFHDRNGISSKKEFLDALKEHLCKSPSSYQSRRELVQGSTEIYPLFANNIIYGVVQIGNHRFYERQADKKEQYAGSAKFTHVWMLENGDWRLLKGLSYDHQETDLANYQTSFFDNDQEIEDWLKQNNIPTLGLGIITNGKLNQVKVFGELQPNVTAPYNTLFNVASLTKPITAIVTLKLVSNGEWDLDAPLYPFWMDPDVSQDEYAKLLTTRDILSHQTGFPNWRENNADGKLTFEFKPGTQYSYSGEGFEYLRKALEKKFNKTLDELANELLFTPLKMTDTHFMWNSDIDSARVAIGYSNAGIPYPTVKRTMASAADDLLTTVEDYGLFLTDLLNGSNLSEDVRKDLTSHQVATKKDKYFGLGFEIYDLKNGDYALSHGGSDAGCQTLFILLPKTKQGIIIFTNVDDGYKVYAQLLTHYLGEYGKKIIEIETR